MNEILHHPHAVARALGQRISADTIRAYCRRGRISGVKVSVHDQVTPLTGAERHHAEGLVMWMVPQGELDRLKREYGIR